MVDLWTNQNAEKQCEKSLAAERKASDLRNIELEKEKLEIERELENRKRIEKQNILKAELQQQIQELSKSFGTGIAVLLVQWARKCILGGVASVF